ncbi:hypothetical protein C5167_009394 [Papaver somniferum]|uniref:Uncharacterized protein n=1 Tax=Papaver somniferum TaxID=3469 RepID=A0A4Y7K164_PAPSO|nr:hypothetical protein C5167_009394 [Papaver somniferum]
MRRNCSSTDKEKLTVMLQHWWYLQRCWSCCNGRNRKVEVELKLDGCSWFVARILDYVLAAMLALQRSSDTRFRSYKGSAELEFDPDQSLNFCFDRG